MFYLGYDEGKYSVVYYSGEVLTIEQSSDFNKSNTQGTEDSLGGSIGKDATGLSGSVTGSKKWSESNSKANGEATKRTLGATKYNELKSLGFTLADDYQRLIVKLDNKVRVCYNNDPIWKLNNKSMYKTKIIRMSGWIDLIGFEIRSIFANNIGYLAARQTNVN